MCRPRLCLAAHLPLSTCWLPPASTVPGFITHLAFCLHSPSMVSPNTYLCFSVPELILYQPLPWVPAILPLLYSLASLAKPTLWLTWSTCCP